MRIAINDLKELVSSINSSRGFDVVEYNTIGAIHLYKDGIGYAVDEIMNTSGGNKRLAGGGLTKSEAYYYLKGLDK